MLGGIQHDKGNAAGAKLPLLGVMKVAGHEDDPDGAAVQNPLDPVQVRLLAIVRARYNHAHAVLTSQPFDPGDCLGSP